MVNNHTIRDFCVARIGRADIEGSKSGVDKNSWPPQASYPCGDFSVTSGSRTLDRGLGFENPNPLTFPRGSLGRAFASRTDTEGTGQASICPDTPWEISVLPELTLGHLRYSLADVPPQPNSLPDNVPNTTSRDIPGLIH